MCGAGIPCMTRSQNFRIFFVAFHRDGTRGRGGATCRGSLVLVSDQMERMYQLKKKIRSAMIYPAIILIAIGGIGILMMIKVVPVLAQTFAEVNATLPASTQFIITVSNFLVRYTVLAVGGIIVFFAVIYTALRTPCGTAGE